MASVDDLSDSELRIKLAELGSPVGPVTETTRKVLIKKLKRLLQAERGSSSPGKQRPNLSRLSSGEDDSQSEDMPSMPPPTRVRNLRRRTIGSSEVPSPVPEPDDSAKQIGTSKVTSSKTTRRSIAVTTVSSKNTDGFDTGSDSDVAEFNNEETVHKRKPLRAEPDITARGTAVSPRSTFADRGHTSKLSESSHSYDILKDYRKIKSEEDVPSRVPVSSFTSDFSSKYEGWTPTNTVYRSSLSPQRETSNSYISGVSKRFESRSFDVYPKRTTDTKLTDDYQKRMKELLKSRAQVPSNGRHNYINWLVSKYYNRSTLFVFIGVIALLLIMLFLYLAFSSSLIGIDGDGNIYPICESGQNHTVCIEPNHLDGALKVYKLLLPKLQDMAVKAYCTPIVGDPIETSTLSEEAAVGFLSIKLPKNKSFELERYFRDLKILVLSNPQWGLEVVDQSPSGADNVKTLVVTGGVRSINPSLPFGCYMQLALLKFGWWALLFLLIAIIVGAAVYGVRWYRLRHEQHKRDVYAMVNKILLMLQGHYKQDEDQNFLAVDNCRDELIPPLHRDNMNNVWEDAVDFIEKSESRVRTEMHNLRGENIKIWRWHPAKGPPLSPSSANTSFDRLL